MQLTDDDFREFIDLWSYECHEAITTEEARLSASMILDLYALLASVESGEDL
jgi:hypothetical protein